ncbi:MAG: apolipoprotein N-acyltransferase [Acidobacteria bacterium]|nr:apolipoprotein N-acyltransferase [Acidobacteriota bacterium]
MNLLLALLTAALLILTVPKVNAVWLAPVALAPLLVAVAREPRPWRRFLAGYACGIAYWFGVCYWIQFVLSFHGGLGEPLGWAVFLLFCLVKGLHLGVFAAGAGILIRSRWAVPAVAALWVAIEVTHGFLGFAWHALGNAGVEMGIPMRLAPLTGVYGLSFVFALMSAALALALLRRPRTQLLWLALLPLLVLLPQLPAAERGREAAVVIQPDLPETEQWTSESVARMQERLVGITMRAAQALQRSGTRLIVWPEMPGPFYYYEDPGLREAVNNLARSSGSYFLLSVVGRTAAGAPLNSALVVSPDGEALTRYDKIKLAPFGEFVPWPFWFANNISSEISDFHSGSRIVVSDIGRRRLAAFICYESVFPNLVRRFPLAGAEVLFNLSNDGWFGQTAAREQHLKIVRMRAAENRRWIVRATNDGLTAVIDPAGRVLQTLPQFVEAAALAQFSYVSGTTPYTRYGDWFAAMCAIVAGAALIAARRQQA